METIGWLDGNRKVQEDGGNVNVEESESSTCTVSIHAALALASHHEESQLF